MEQGTGIEPALTAWEAAVIPIYQPCEICSEAIIANFPVKCKVNFVGTQVQVFFTRRPHISYILFSVAHTPYLSRSP